MSSTGSVHAYHRDTLFSHEFPYEGFSNIESSNSDPYINDLMIKNANANDCKKVHGIDGLFCKPFVADSRIDRFSEAKGSASCFGKSSGLSNSKGSLCLGNDLTTLLRTRGGNQTGGPDQIGY
uniref:Uncharacterized protein n=1 Tax=viral metagenome TaxID=1070528 RepID=A0A6C0JJP5_9ZZZZ